MTDSLARTELSRLPQWVQAKVRELEVGDGVEIERWIKEPIPALGHRSISEVATAAGGEEDLRQYFSRFPR